MLKNLLSGITFGALGQTAKDIRAAITGKEVLSEKERLLVLEKVSQIENAVLQAESSIALAQIELNKTEANSPSIFKSGWRPFVGWCCAFGFFYEVAFKVFFIWAITFLNSQFNLSIPIPPDINYSVLQTVLFGMLGLGGFRTFEKIKKGI